MIEKYQFDESQRAVLYGLQVIMERELGIGTPISASTLFVPYLREAGVWEELDLAEIFYDIDQTFEVQIPFSEWESIFPPGTKDPSIWERSVTQRVTFGHLAAFIAARLQVLRLSPAKILGKNCAQAGAFRTIEHFIEMIDRDGGRFGPSTPIRDRLRGSKLRRVWNQLSWLSEGRLPALRTTPSEIFLTCLLYLTFLGFVVTCASGLLALFDKDRFEEFVCMSGVFTSSLMALGLVLCVLLWALSPILSRIESKLPTGFRTFRDVAVAMAPVD